MSPPNILWHVSRIEEVWVIEIVCSRRYNDIWIAAVREELPCEYEARNTKDMLWLCCRYFCFRVSRGHHDGKVPPLVVVGSHIITCYSMPKNIWSVKYFVYLIFVVLLHLQVPWKSPHRELTMTMVCCVQWLCNLVFSCVQHFVL